MTLAEFLLARIAEDERRAADSHRIECAHLDAYVDGFGPPSPCNCDLPAQVLAECEAKRRIVERLAEWERGVLVHAAGGMAISELRIAARFLTLPYADHPDYDEIWRP